MNIEELQKQNAELVLALQPFARFHKIVADNPATDRIIDQDGVKITVKHFRNAYNATKAELPAPQDADWQACELISGLPDVDEALFGFSADPTGDNATCVVRAILAAVRPTAANAVGQQQCRHCRAMPRPQRDYCPASTEDTRFPCEPVAPRQAAADAGNQAAPLSAEAVYALADEHCSGRAAITGAYMFKPVALTMFAEAIQDARHSAVGAGDQGEILGQVREAVLTYFDALAARQHGGVAQDKAFNSIQQALGLSWQFGVDHRAAQKGGA